MFVLLVKHTKRYDRLNVNVIYRIFLMYYSKVKFVPNKTSKKTLSVEYLWSFTTL